MTELDGGTSAVPLRVLADCCRVRGQLAETRRYLELCRDAERWDPGYSPSPGVCSPVQKALRQADRSPGSVVVDLPELLSQYNGGLADRRLFLDYCHLNSQGIKIATAAIASQVIQFLAGQSVSAQALQDRCPTPAAKIEGKAAILAAVHNAHYYQRAEVVGYWCRRALQLWPDCVGLMARLLDCQTRNLPLIACKSGLELLQLDEFGMMQYISRGTATRVDITLSKAFAAALDQADAAFEHEIAELRLRLHGVKHGTRELTSFYYSSAVPGHFERGWTSRSFPNNRGSRSIYASAFWETAKFLFFADAGRPVRVRITFRLPPSTAAGEVAIEINGARVATLRAEATWRTETIDLPGDGIVQGLNQIVVVWPTDAIHAERVLERAADELLAGRLPAFFRVFGEIHALSVFDPQPSSQERARQQSEEVSRMAAPEGKEVLVEG
jgi:hypothetical protein